MFFKEHLTEWFLVGPKMVLLWHHLKIFIIFKSITDLEKCYQWITNAHHFAVNGCRQNESPNS